MPLDIKRGTLQSLRRLLPRMRLADQAGMSFTRLTRVLDVEDVELRLDVLNVLISLEVSLGREYALFLPVVKRAFQSAASRIRLSTTWSSESKVAIRYSSMTLNLNRYNRVSHGT